LSFAIDHTGDFVPTETRNDLKSRLGNVPARAQPNPIIAISRRRTDACLVPDVLGISALSALYLPYHPSHVFDRSDSVHRLGGTSPASCTSPLHAAVRSARETQTDELIDTRLPLPRRPRLTTVAFFFVPPSLERLIVHHSPLPSFEHLMPITERPAEIFVRGEGAWLWDSAGKRYLDWLQGWAVNALGHCPPLITQALQAQSTQLLTPSPAVYNLPALKLAERLCELSGFDQVFFGSTGAEVNEGAIKLARKWGRTRRAGAHEIITFENSFHGRNLATMAASGKAGWDQLFRPQMPGFAKSRLNDLESVLQAINERTVAVMLEPVQGEAGVRPASPAFLRALRQLCDERGLLLIFDEIQTGCGRLGHLFGFQQSGVKPDIMTLGKGLGGGVPISAVLAQKHCSVFEYGDQGGTYAGNPLMCAVSLEVLEVLRQPDFLAHVRSVGRLLRSGLEDLSTHEGLGEVRGAGLLLALELDDEAAPTLVRECRAQGLLVNAARPNCLRFMPRLNSTVEEVQHGLTTLGAVLRQVRNPAKVAA